MQLTTHRIFLNNSTKETKLRFFLCIKIDRKRNKQGIKWVQTLHTNYVTKNQNQKEKKLRHLRSVDDVILLPTKNFWFCVNLCLQIRTIFDFNNKYFAKYYIR